MNANYLDEFYRALSELPDYCYIKEFSPITTNELGNTLLHAAASLDDVEAIKQLVEQGANLEARGEYGMTPLHFAVLKDNRNAVKILVDLGANQNAENDDGVTPLSLDSKGKES